MSTAITDQVEETLDRSGQVLALAVPAQVRLRVSDEDFWRLCQENPDLRLERTAQGELIVMPPAAPDGSQRNMSLGAQLWNWNQQTEPRRGVRLVGRFHPPQYGHPRTGRLMDDHRALGARSQ